jgi:hypothetical protein
MQWTLPLMQAHLLKNYIGAKQLGIYSMPLFDFCEIDNILPNILHEKINTGNDLIACIRSYTDRRIEMITPEESLARTASLAAEIALDECKESIEQYSFAIQAMRIMIDDLDAMKLERGGGSFTEDEQDDYDAHQEEITTLEEECEHFVDHILPYAKLDYATKKKAFMALWKEKRSSEFQVWNYIDNNIFQKHGMRTQAYHGGYKFSGVDVGKFLGNADAIIPEIEVYLI